MVKYFLKYTLLAAVLVSLVACGKDNGDNPKSSLLLVKMDTEYVNKANPSNVNRSTSKFTYDNQGKLEKVFSDYSTNNVDYDKEEMVIYYAENGSIVGSFKTSLYSGNFSKSKVDQFDDAGNIAKISFYSDDTAPDKVLEYKWSNGKLIELRDALNNVTTPISYTNGNITQLGWSVGGEAMSYTATFDDKHTLQSLMPEVFIAVSPELYSFLNFPEDNETIAILNTNNILRSTFSYASGGGAPQTLETTYVYEYNEDGYPTKIIKETPFSKITTVYTYEKR